MKKDRAGFLAAWNLFDESWVCHTFKMCFFVKRKNEIIKLLKRKSGFSIKFPFYLKLMLKSLILWYLNVKFIKNSFYLKVLKER